MKANIIIDEGKCKGCGLCVVFCPRGELVIEKTRQRKMNAVAVFLGGGKCTGCMSCALMCPDAAIEVKTYGKK